MLGRRVELSRDQLTMRADHPVRVQPGEAIDDLASHAERLLGERSPGFSTVAQGDAVGEEPRIEFKSASAAVSSQPCSVVGRGPWTAERRSVERAVCGIERTFLVHGDDAWLCVRLARDA